MGNSCTYSYLLIWKSVTDVCKINFSFCRFEKQDGVVLMATTRNLKQIDEALQRPGRMDRIFHLQLPTQAERERILQIAAKETMDPDLIDFVDWQKVRDCIQAFYYSCCFILHQSWWLFYPLKCFNNYQEVFGLSYQGG